VANDIQRRVVIQTNGKHPQPLVVYTEKLWGGDSAVTGKPIKGRVVEDKVVKESGEPFLNAKGLPNTLNAIEPEFEARLVELVGDKPTKDKVKAAILKLREEQAKPKATSKKGKARTVEVPALTTEQKLAQLRAYMAQLEAELAKAA
jgi:hypothetical protein